MQYVLLEETTVPRAALNKKRINLFQRNDLLIFRHVYYMKIIIYTLPSRYMYFILIGIL